jgi:hydroxymethylpyrimidine/phosphomethylpyrimidine kinase
VRPVALTIAGFDPTTAAGVGADLRVFHQAGVDGRAVLALLTAQGAQGVTRAVPVEAALVEAQIAALLIEGRPGAVKTGALGSEANVRAIARSLGSAGLAPIVDPVILSSSGHALLDAGGVRALRDVLLPIARLVTPNAPEAEALTGERVEDVASAERAGRAILARGAAAVLVKGGHLEGAECIDVLVTPSGTRLYTAPRSARRDIRGTGCSLSAAITALLADGEDLATSIALAKTWLTAAIEGAPTPAEGRGPLDHFAPFPLRARGRRPV